MTLRTYCFTAVTTQHNPVLDLVLILSQHLEEGIDRNLFVHIVCVTRKTVPEHVFLGACQTVIRLEDGEVVFHGSSAELILPHLHLVSMPTLYTSFVHAERRVGDDQSFINTNNTAETFARRTGAKRRVEGEHVLVRLLERHTVGLVTSREIIADITW